jgi:hypothetical protein
MRAANSTVSLSQRRALFRRAEERLTARSTACWRFRTVHASHRMNSVKPEAILSCKRSGLCTPPPTSGLLGSPQVGSPSRFHPSIERQAANASPTWVGSQDGAGRPLASGGNSGFYVDSEVEKGRPKPRPDRPRGTRAHPDLEPRPRARTDLKE